MSQGGPYAIAKHRSLRLQRLRLASLASAAAAAIVLGAALAGLLPLAAAARFALAVLALAAGLYVLVRAGWNLRLRDPSLTIPMLVGAGLAISYVVYEGHAARPAFLALYLIAFMFGAFSLSGRQLGAVALLYVGLYAGVVGLLAAWRPGTTDLHRELLRVAGMAVILGWFSVLGGYLSRLRNQLREANERLEAALRDSNAQALRDALTGCYNRRFATEQLEREALGAARGAPFAVCLCDLDRFKGINDLYGHGAGDEVLCAFAGSAGSALRGTDVLARYGGEEFLVILPGTEAAAAAQVAERLRARCAALVVAALPAGRRITVSIGVAQHRAAEPVRDTLARADRALYQAKAEGRDRVVVDG